MRSIPPPAVNCRSVARKRDRAVADWDGTVMEQKGRNRSQTFAGRKWLGLRRTAATGCHRLPFGSHGKRAVFRFLKSADVLARTLAGPDVTAFQHKPGPSA